MEGNSDIRLVSSTDELFSLKSEKRGVLGVDVYIYDRCLHFDISFCNGMVGLESMVSVARDICDKITDVVVAKKLELGERIPCCQGCSSCCNYLVTASSAEIFSLSEDVKNLDASLCRYFQRSAIISSKKILKKKPPEYFDEMELDKISNWYKGLNLSCPFLFENGCGIHKFRPLSCREYFIKGSPNVCKGKRGSAAVIRMPVSIANVLNELCRELESESDTSVVLALFQVWADENSHRKLNKWPACDLVRRFIELLEMATLNGRAESQVSSL